MLGNQYHTRAGMNVSAPTSTITATRNSTNSGVWVGSVPAPAGNSLLHDQGPGRSQHRYHKPESPDEHGAAERVVL